MDKEAIKKQAKDQLLAKIADGVNRFSTPAPRAQEPQADKQESDALGPVALSSVFPDCGSCPLGAHRKRMVISGEQTKKRFFALAEFPQAEDESANELFVNEKSPVFILNKLFTRLGIWENVHRSFALKCFPRQGVLAGMYASCGQALKQEIENTSPEVLFCFGARAVSVLARALPLDLNSCPEVGELQLREDSPGGPRVFVLPSPQELDSFPEWRSPVWQLLLEFRARI